MKRPVAALLGLLLCWTGPLIPSGPRALAQSRDERAVRAAYVYNLLQYIDWPPGKTELVIGFDGDPATGEILRTLLDGRNSNGRPVRVVLFPTAQELRNCSIFYLSDGPTRGARQAMDSLQGSAVVTIGETDPFAREGGMVALINTGDHIRIEVNLDATEQAGIHISSRVLSLATIVHSAQNGGR